MRLLKDIYAACVWAAAVAGMLTMGSCQDELISTPDYTVSGEDVTVSVPLSLPELDVKSRNALSDEQLNRVETLWIRSYSAVTGMATSEWVKVTADVPGVIKPESIHKVTFKSQSGSSYIIGVANVETNNGVLKDDPTATPQPLSSLLDAADTWENFLNIAVETPNTDNAVNTAPSPVAMAGCYTNLVAGGSHTIKPHRIDDWQTVSFTPVFIPASDSGSVELTNGALHLRRLVSHLTFNIISGPAVDVTVQSYTVCNVPRYTWLYERSTTEGRTANFGDAAETPEQAEEVYYTTLQQFSGNFISEGQVIVNNTPTACQTFDFWQGENKHQALAAENCDSYNKRERENKTTPDGNGNVTNTGLYTSLTGATWTPNNMASYVLVRCLVDYKKPVNVDENGNQGDEVMYRSGTAEYVVHLGYCEGSDEAVKSADFNCFRNVDYTYNLTVNGVNDIRVEALRNDEAVPGAEGLVTDVMNPTINLDAHYAAFNIELTADDLKNFGFIITAYENGVEHTYTETDAVPAGEEKYINWIELRPTDNARRLARYYPGNCADEALRPFTLKDMSEKNSRFKESVSGYYTVFVNEYTYEAGVGETNYGDERSAGTGNPAWMGYVNQDPRRFYIRVTRSVSNDGESIYARSKYAVSQLSIQTYYSDRVITPAKGAITRGTAIGVEHENELEGLNLRRSDDGIIAVADTSHANGRWNVWKWAENKNFSWQEVLSFDGDYYVSVQERPEVAESRLQNGPALPARTVLNGNPIKLPRIADYAESATAGAYDPQTGSSKEFPARYIEAINACMNRNRDNNGNGIIDAAELRWYVPAMGQYLRVILGRNSLQDPIMDYENVKEMPSKSNGNNSRYLFYSSEGRELWAMEGLSTSSWTEWNTSEPWQVRCIRNLGTDLRDVAKEDKVTAAYGHDAATRTVKMTYYDLNSVRTTPYSGNGEGEGQMPTHLINSKINMVYKAFQYSEGINGWYDYYEDRLSAKQVQEYIYKNPCAGLNTATVTGWRIPNQKELAIMRNLGLFDKGESFLLSCTASYYDEAGIGGEYVDGSNYFMGSRSDGATLLNSGNLANTDTHIYVRCVRDVEP